MKNMSAISNVDQKVDTTELCGGAVYDTP